MTFAELVFALFAELPQLARTTGIAAVIGLVVALVLPPSYDARVSFYPESRSPGTSLSSSLANFASMYGLGDLTSGSESPRFYASIATSAAVLDPILADSMTSTASPRTKTPVPTLLKVRPSSPQTELADGRKILRDMMKVNADIQTNIVSITVTSRDPVLAWGLANAVLRGVNAFNVQRRNSRAKSARLFAEARQQWARDQLQFAEDSVRTFLMTNRSFESSPTLRLRYEALQRQVTLAQGVYVSVSQQVEQSRIQEVNDIPVITVVDTAMVPPRKARPKRRNVVLVFLALGVLSATAQVAAKAIIDKRLASGDEELRNAMTEFRQRYERLWASLPWRRRGGDRA